MDRADPPDVGEVDRELSTALTAEEEREVLAICAERGFTTSDALRAAVIAWVRNPPGQGDPAVEAIARADGSFDQLRRLTDILESGFKARRGGRMTEEEGRQLLETLQSMRTVMLKGLTELEGGGRQ